MEINDLLKKISECHEADIFLYSGEIAMHHADALVQVVNSIESRNKNVILVLTTYGGSPDAGYRIARLLKKKYERFYLYVFGYCKSAGTLIALGADEIVMSEFGELGPLDMQVTKEDELRITSSLDYMQTISSIQSQAFNMFEDFFLSLLKRSGYAITTKTAASIATELTTGILAPIAEQIDPVRMCEVQRTLNLALKYGNQLTTDADLVTHLITDYPSHGCIIDYQEAKDLFPCVREPHEVEQQLANSLSKIVRNPITPDFVRLVYPIIEQERGNECESECSGEGAEGAIQNSDAPDSADEQVIPNNNAEIGTPSATYESFAPIQGSEQVVGT